MGKKPTGKPFGRPPIEIDKEQFEKLCYIQCTEQEICDEWYNCSVDTLERWCQKTYGVTFADIYRIKRGRGKKSLRRTQLETALKGNTTMMIWLGKQYLGQSDKFEQRNIDAEEKMVAKLSDDELIALIKESKAKK